MPARNSAVNRFRDQCGCAANRHFAETLHPLILLGIRLADLEKHTIWSELAAKAKARDIRPRILEVVKFKSYMRPQVVYHEDWTSGASCQTSCIVHKSGMCPAERGYVCTDDAAAIDKCVQISPWRQTRWTGLRGKIFDCGTSLHHAMLTACDVSRHVLSPV